ncbi:hypothetical protein A2W14_06285 [Candidatus Gottesmanbacteria bacterium RBG_16_37_8]|uniref:Glycosyltransferase RgtA/B/C/D-like domain-containing protein n=1 Tax=Candidatus Gottesmanbacteria bacterium RBG_16_37_8 TaxID=1798371 RepID=A0A1F5YX53_9BACT|nr:MAG: hypothetical protein A2W14_06285 [Candidatus Gottesmanbacteria bacterium RBG_16_37_8]
MKTTRIIIITLFLSFLYFLVFSFITFPAIKFFSTHFFTGYTDGFAHIWNLWWIKKAVTELHTSIWFTDYLHYPHGISLYGHALNPFNGYLFLFLSEFLTFIQAHNVIIIFTFVSAGVTAYWLSYYFTKSYWASFFGGFIFSFSSYHFAHTLGHMELISIEWIPLFTLCWYKFMTKPNILNAIFASISLYLVLLCSDYYFIYCLLIAAIIIVWFAVKNRSLFLINKKYYLPLFIFIVSTLLTSGPIVLAYYQLIAKDFIFGMHTAQYNSLDLFGLFIPGGLWRFADLTKSYWSQLASNNIAEDSVHIGFSTIIVLIYLLINRKKINMPSFSLWLVLLIFFALMSFGPILHLKHLEIPYLLLPYALLEKILPFLGTTGMPIRMVLIVYLAVSVLFAKGIWMLSKGPLKNKIITLFILILLFFEYLPKPLSLAFIQIPPYINALEKLPAGALIDQVSDRYINLYYQTIHNKPMAFGYTSRTPASVYDKSNIIDKFLTNHDYKTLCNQYNFRYVLTSSDTGDYPALEKYNDGSVKIYDLMNQNQTCLVK